MRKNSVVKHVISDSVIRIKNGIGRGKKYVYVIKNKIMIDCLKKMASNDLIRFFKPFKGLIKVFLAYDSEKSSVINNIKAISLPAKRVYMGINSIRSLLQPMRIILLSTNAGILTHRECFEKNMGGEVLFYVE